MLPEVSHFNCFPPTRTYGCDKALVGFVLAHTFQLPPEVAAGLVLVGVSPSGLASNVMAYLAKADLALSVTLTAVATLLAPLLTPILMRLLAGQMIAIDVPAMIWSITKIVLVPVLAGVVFHHTFYKRFRWLDRAMPLLSMVGIYLMTVLTVAVGRDNLLQMGALLILACFLHCSAGFILGYFSCRGLGLDKLTCRTISLEVGLQNAGMASGIAAELRMVSTLGLAPIIFGPVMNITASSLANWWRIHPVQGPIPTIKQAKAVRQECHELKLQLRRWAALSTASSRAGCGLGGESVAKRSSLLAQ